MESETSRLQVKYAGFQHLNVVDDEQKNSLKEELEEWENASKSHNQHHLQPAERAVRYAETELKDVRRLTGGL